VEQRRKDHLVDVDLLGVVGVLGHLHGLGVEPPDEAVVEIADEEEEPGDDDVGDGRAEIGPDLFFHQGPDVCHCSSPPETIFM
jgi:hypothetical protein